MEIEILDPSNNCPLDLWAISGFVKIMSNEEMDIYQKIKL
jgi:hypothetical protein